MADRSREAHLGTVAEHYRQLVEQMPVGIFQSAPDGTIFTCNEAFVSLVGARSRDEVLAVNARRLYMDPEDRDRLLARLGQSDVVEGHEQRWRRLDGRLIWVMVTVRRIPWDDGPRLEGVAVDVTDRKVAAEATARLAAIVESSSDAIVGHTVDGIVTSWNAAAERLYGYTRREMLGRSWSVLVAPERPDEVTDLLSRVARGEHVTNYEAVRVMRDGRRVDVALTLSPVRDESGAIIGGAMIGRDLSPYRRAETLARRAEELRRSNDDLQQFAYVASHDLQEPLRTVAAYVQLLDRRYRDRLDDDGHEFMRYAVDGVHRMQALVRDLLAYARVETRGRSLVEMGMDEALDAALANLTVSREETGAVVTRDPLPRVQGDQTQLTALFQNLIANAIKFRGAEPPRIHVSARRESDQWRFAVTDNGIGIPPEHRDRVFVIFQRLHTREEYPGTGVGLTLCKRIVERHGGRIGIESAGTTGTSVWFTLPGDVPA